MKLGKWFSICKCQTKYMPLRMDFLVPNLNPNSIQITHDIPKYSFTWNSSYMRAFVRCGSQTCMHQISNLHAQTTSTPPPPHPKSQFTFAAPHSNTANMHMLIWEQTSNKRKSCCFGAGCRMNVIHTNVYQQAVDHLHYCRTSLSSCPACLSASLHVCPPYYSNHHRSARKWKNATVESFMTTWLVTLWSVARRKNDMYGNQVHIAPCVIDIWDDNVTSILRTYLYYRDSLYGFLYPGETFERHILHQSSIDHHSVDILRIT